MKFVRLLSQINVQDTILAGGKWASLGEMISANIPVPGWFVILSHSFDEFIQKTGLDIQIDTILKQVHKEIISSVEHASAVIQDLILSAPMSENMSQEIYDTFDSEWLQWVAVRSSATAEDWIDHAWAGQLDSFLNTTRSTLIEKIRHCWASLFTPRAIFYRFEKGLHESHISVAVVVQKMVQSEMSWIAFSVHPVTQNYNQMIIEAWFWLGEAIVSWAVTPDSYIVQKNKILIESISVHSQQRALYKKESGGNEWVSLWEKSEQQVLSSEQIIKLANIIVIIERHYGFPCDIEWWYQDDQFYILQSRPITTLAPEPEYSQELSNMLEPYKSWVIQLWSYQNLYPLDCEIWHGDQHNEEFYKLFEVRKWAVQYFDHDQGICTCNVIIPIWQAKQLFDGWERYKKRHWQKSLQQLLETFYMKRKEFESIVNQHFIDKEFEQLNTNELLDLFLLRIDLLSKMLPFDLFWYLSTDLRQAKLYEILESKWLDKKSDEFNTVLASLIEPETPSSSYFEYIDILQSCLHILNSTQDTKTAARILSKKWWHIPVFCYGEVRDYSHYVHEITLILEKMQVWDIQSTITEYWQHTSKRTELIKLYQHKYSLSDEEIQYFIDFSLVSLTKDEAEIFNGYISQYAPRIFKELAKRLDLTEKEFKYLYVSEVINAFKGVFDYKSLIRERQQTNIVELYSEDLTKKYVLLDNTKEIQTFLKSKNKSLQSDASCAYPGKVQGVVKIINSVEEVSKVEDGDIMICQTTTVDYLLGMRKAWALITEYGWLTCHAAVVAREFKTPCIVWMKNVRQQFQDGDFVEVDASKWNIKILSNN